MTSAVLEKEKREELPGLLKPSRKKRSRWMTALLCSAGIFLILLGIAGTVLATGLPFFLAGFAFFAICFPTVRGWINRGEKHLPYKFRVYMRRMLQKVPIKKFRAMFSEPPASS